MYPSLPINITIIKNTINNDVLILFLVDIFIFIIKDYSNPKLEGVSEEMVLKTDENGNQVTDQSDYFYAEKDECSKHSTKFSNGYGCTPFAIKNICPDDSSKTYWECLP